MMNCLLGGDIKSSSTSSPSPSPVSNKINSNNCNSLNINPSTQTGHNQNHSNNNTTTSLNSQETCLICGDVASGKHYGLRSCEACKAFFKRTVQGKIEYSCPATRECEINKRRRKACQACRFQKCLNMGMLKEGVRLDRVRGGRQKYRRGLSPGPGGGGGGSGGGGGGGGNVVVGPNAGGSANSGNLCGGIALGGSTGSGAGSGSVGQTGGSGTLGSSNICPSETNRIMTALINCEPEELTASPAQIVNSIPSTLSVQMKTLYILSDLFDRELVSLIGWAKQIPGFSETITLNDQMRLLQSTWAEVIALSIGYRSHLKRMDNHRQQHGSGGQFVNTTPSPTSSSPASTASSYNHNGNSLLYNLENTEIRLVFAKDLIIDFKHAVACGAEEIFYNCVQLIKRLDYLRITPNEYIILKAISLTNADVRLENPKATHQLRDLIMDTLYEATLGDHLMINSSASSISITSGQKDNIGNNVSLTGNHHNHVQLKFEAQERPLSSMNQYAASTSPPRPSPSVQSSSSLSSISPHNNNNSTNANNFNIDSNNLANKRAIINHRLNQVLLCLPVLRQIDSCIRRFWNDVRKGPNNVPMNKLFEEMLEPCQRIYKSAAEM